MLELSKARYYNWLHRSGGGKLEDKIGKSMHLDKILPWEIEACISYAREHTREGYRRLAWMMVDEAIVYLSPSTVYRILLAHDLLYRWKRTNSGTLNKPPTPQKPDEQWHTDIMYLWISGRWYFLVSVLDGYSRYIVHWELLTSMRADEVVDVVHRALEKTTGHPRIVHDNGSQFKSKEYRGLIKQFELEDIKVKVSHPESNGLIERFHRTVREEGIGEEELRDLYQARDIIASWVRHYNEERLHGAINYLRPWDYYYGNPELVLAARQKKLERARIIRKERNLRQRELVRVDDFRQREQFLEKVQL